MNVSRARSAWWIAILFFTFMVVLNSAQFTWLLRKPSKSSSTRDAFSLIATDFQVVSLLGLGQKENLKGVQRSLYELWGTDFEGEARLRQIVMEREWQPKTSPSLLRGIESQFPNKTQSERAQIAYAMHRIYGSNPLTPDEVPLLIDQLSLAGEGWWLTLARAKAYEKAKQEDKARSYRQSLQLEAQYQLILLGLLIFAGLVVLMVGVGLLVWIVATQWWKTIPAKPFPDLPPYAFDGSLSGFNAYFYGMLLLDILLIRTHWESQGLFMQFSALVISLYFLYRWQQMANPPVDWLGLQKGRFVKSLFQGAMAYGVMVALLLPVLFCLGLLILPHLPEQSNPLIEEAFTTEDPWLRWRVFIQAVIFAPLIEEIIFRGVLFQVLWQQTGKVWLSAAMSGFLFAVIHPQFLGGLVPVALLGMICAILFAKTRSLVPCIVLHAMNNGVIVGFSLMIR